jgi:hypothetical protein
MKIQTFGDWYPKFFFKLNLQPLILLVYLEAEWNDVPLLTVCVNRKYFENIKLHA